jgi:peptide/nickel transport system permease protein
MLMFMFVFAFLVPDFLSVLGRPHVFFKYDNLEKTYAAAQERTEYACYTYDDSVDIPTHVKNSVNSSVQKMEENKETQSLINYDGKDYLLQKEGEGIYTLSTVKTQSIASFSTGASVATYGKTGLITNDKELGADFEAAVKAAIDGEKSDLVYKDETYIISNSVGVFYNIFRLSGSTFRFNGEAMGEAFEKTAESAALRGDSQFTLEGKSYQISSAGQNSYSVSGLIPDGTGYVASVFTFDTTDGSEVSAQFKAQALYHAYLGDGFTADGVDYTVKEENGELEIYKASDPSNMYALYTTFVVRDYMGQDSYDLKFKAAVEEQLRQMSEAGLKTAEYTYSLPKKQVEIVVEKNKETGEEEEHEVVTLVKDKDGNPVYADKEIKIALEGGQYELRWSELTHQIDRYSGPSSEHIFGTDGDGMDIFARMMYGGRISLMVGFVVVLLETFLGVIMGGISGYFGGWIDNLIMRLVDIFYCIPSLPILIIIGSMMDKMKVNAYVRLVYLMAILGVLGWAGVARLVRGQILSLREQEFMIATEATGIRVRKRIFRHLMPNVMPQLIVTATSGLGGVIITESTLSFLGIGVRHPLATWGTMINSVTSTNEDMIKYTYIWIPVGLLICLTVIAFNFVGDGLRDAFDPKMKR